MSGIAKHRARYAKELRRLRGLETEALVKAFATVPREDYLGPGPWRILSLSLGDGYQDTPDDDPRHLYENVLVAIDEERRLNNGEPAGLAGWFDRLELRSGDRVLHLGCGVGYYTAILAETVGPRGHVLGLEIDVDLAKRAADNLAHYPHVEVRQADGSHHATTPRDAIFVNAGATHPRREWLDALAPGGRLLLPLTVSFDPSGIGGGHVLKVTRLDGGFAARFVSPVGIYPCTGARDEVEEEALRDAYTRGGEGEVRSLRLAPYPRDDSCWLAAPSYCLSTASVEGRN